MIACGSGSSQTAPERGHFDLAHISTHSKKKNDCCQLVYFVEVEARIKEIEKNMYVFEDFT